MLKEKQPDRRKVAFSSGLIRVSKS